MNSVLANTWTFTVKELRSFFHDAVLLGLVIFMWPAASHLADRVVGSGVAGTLLTVGLYLILVVTSALTVPSAVLSPASAPQVGWLTTAVQLGSAGVRSGIPR